MRNPSGLGALGFGATRRISWGRLEANSAIFSADKPPGVVGAAGFAPVPEGAGVEEDVGRGVGCVAVGFPAGVSPCPSTLWATTTFFTTVFFFTTTTAFFFSPSETGSGAGIGSGLACLMRVALGFLLSNSSDIFGYFSSASSSSISKLRPTPQFGHWVILIWTGCPHSGHSNSSSYSTASSGE